MKTKTKHILLAVLLIWLLPAITQALYQPVGIITSLIRSQFATVFSSTYDIATPAGSDSPSEADDRMRETKAAIQERLAVEHRFALTGTEVSAADTGEHTDITTDSIVNAGLLTVGTTLGVTGDFAVNTDKFTVTASSGNTLVAGTLDVTGNIDPTTYETTNGGFLDEDDLVSDAADKVASQQSIKAYTDSFNGPFARMWLDGAQNATTSSTVVAFDTDEFDDDNITTFGADAKITPGVAGFYIVTATVTFGSVPEQRNVTVDLYKNTTINASAIEHIGVGPTNLVVPVTVTAIIELDADDFIQVKMEISSGTDAILTTSGADTFLSVGRL